MYPASIAVRPRRAHAAARRRTPAASRLPARRGLASASSVVGAARAMVISASLFMMMSASTSPLGGPLAAPGAQPVEARLHLRIGPAIAVVDPSGRGRRRRGHSCRADGLEEVHAELVDLARAHRQFEGMLRLNPAELHERLVAHHLERRPVEQPRLVVAPQIQLAEHGQLARRQVAGALHAPEPVRVERLLDVRAPSGRPSKASCASRQRFVPCNALAQQIAERQQVVAVEPRIAQLRGRERPLAPVGQLGVLVESHLEVLDAAARPGSPARQPRMRAASIVSKMFAKLKSKSRFSIRISFSAA